MKRHSPNPDNLTFDKEGLLAEIESPPPPSGSKVIIY